jgi:hypothetical protein
MIMDGEWEEAIRRLLEVNHHRSRLDRVKEISKISRYSVSRPRIEPITSRTQLNSVTPTTVSQAT